MDDETVFGPVLYKLSLVSAVSRGLLAGYQAIVLRPMDPVVTREWLIGEERHTEEVRGQRLGALQAALPHTMAQHGLQTCITFHHRTSKPSRARKDWSVSRPSCTPTSPRRTGEGLPQTGWAANTSITFLVAPQWGARPSELTSPSPPVDRMSWGVVSRLFVTWVWRSVPWDGRARTTEGRM
ncbi:hypothetical protein [Streptomyces sp. ok210]|uniref:hypothetical protein n=1 Tax=Streptomyces sp. ok210 TaxID=1761905 RepID=UPI0008EB4F7C|nr:hypothetical protein SAMN04487982_110243 [Streptomyces sp. ok210]